MTDHEYVLASTDPPQIFNFYPTAYDAENDRARANEYGAKCSTPRRYKVLSWNGYHAAERVYYITQPATEITAEQFMYFLEVLPPMGWNRHGTWETFLLSEMHSGVYTQQYMAATVNGTTRYFEKMVSALDRSTWMTPDSIA